MEFYHKSKKIYNTIKYVFETFNIDFNDALEKLLWSQSNFARRNRRTRASN